MIAALSRRPVPMILACAFALAACTKRGVTPPPAVQVPPLPPPVSAPWSFVAAKALEAPLVRGIYLASKPGAPPTITAAHFRKINDSFSGELKFDVQALTKLQSELGQSSTVRDYVMKVSNTKLGIAPDIALLGTYRFVENVGAPIDYDDLREASFWCYTNQLRGNNLHTPEGWRHACSIRRESVQPVDGPGQASRLNGVMTCSPDNVRHRNMNWSYAWKNGVVRGRMQGWLQRWLEGWKSDWQRWVDRAPQAAATIPKAIEKDLNICDPSGKLRGVWNGQGFWDRDNVEILVFSPSTNPLYPPPKYYNLWGVKTSYNTQRAANVPQGEVIKNAFQIWYLVAQQKARMGAAPASAPAAAGE